MLEVAAADVVVQHVAVVCTFQAAVAADAGADHEGLQTKYCCAVAVAAKLTVWPCQAVEV